MSAQHTFGGLVALVALLAAAPCWAQSTGTAPAAGWYRARAGVPPDSAGGGKTGTDSAGGGKAGTDSAAVAPGDTLARQRPDSVARAARPAPPPPAPIDSALGAACGGAAGERTDLLLVKFQASATESERSTVAQEVGGTLVEMSQHAAPGSWYILVPGSAGDPTVADRLILLPPVLEVGATRCPS